MNFYSQICTTKEQSERLLGLGLQKETADMGLAEDIPIAIEDWKTQDTTLIDSPAWSLHRLMEIVPFNLRDKKGYTYDFLIEDDNTISYYYFSEQSWYCTKYWGKSNLYDNFIDCIEWLIKEGYFNKEYLKK